MTFVLPDLEKAKCESFTACAHIVKNEKSSKRSSPRTPLIASVKRGRSQQFIRFFVDGTRHWHLDVATPTFFGERHRPKPSHKWLKIESSLERFMGKELQVHIEAKFSVPLQKLPESGFIRMLSVETKTPKVSMKMTGGTFSVKGGPIHRIIWSLEPDAKRIEVRLRSTVKTKMHETSLQDLFSLLNNSLDVFVLGNERKSLES